MPEINIDRELGQIDAKISHLDKRVDRLELDINSKLKDIKETNDKSLEEIKNGNVKLFEKIEELQKESVFAKGFIKAVLIAGSVVGLVITVVIKFIH